jgi:D-alanyl-D-alanine carboxypeptidase
MRRGLLAAAVAALSVFCGSAAAAPPPVVASAYVVRGPDGAVLASRAADVRRPLASITKLMTVMVALEHARLDEVVTVSPQAASVGESSVSLRAGERLTVRDLAVAALVPSANDAATALAAYVGHGSVPRFVALMNAKAEALGLTSTHFANPHGLDQAGHYSSARDVTTLLGAALRNPFIRTWSTRSSATIGGGRTLTSTDDLLGTLPIVGAKTGHTDGAGWSQVAAAQAHGARVTVSVLGAPSEQQRNGDLAALVTWGLAQFHPVEAVSRRVYGHAETGYGRAPVAIVAPRELVRTVRVGRPLVERIVLSPTLSLPVARGQRVGEVRVFAGRKLIARSPLVTAAAVSSVGTAGKVGWYARRTVHHLVGLLS